MALMEKRLLCGEPVRALPCTSLNESEPVSCSALADTQRSNASEAGPSSWTRVDTVSPPAFRKERAPQTVSAKTNFLRLLHKTISPTTVSSFPSLLVHAHLYAGCRSVCLPQKHQPLATRRKHGVNLQLHVKYSYMYLFQGCRIRLANKTWQYSRNANIRRGHGFTREVVFYSGMVTGRTFPHVYSTYSCFITYKA